MLRTSIQEYLETSSHQVVGFNNGLEVLEILKRETFDLLILDINVPKLKWIRTSKRVKCCRNCNTNYLYQCKLGYRRYK